MTLNSSADLQEELFFFHSAAFTAMWRGDMRDVIKYMGIKVFSERFGEAKMGKV